MGLFDSFGIIVAVVVTAMIALLGYVLFDTLSTSQSVIDFSLGKETFAFFDQALALLFFGLAMASIVSATLIRSHPAYAFMGLLVTLVLIYFSALINNIYIGLFENSFSSAADAFPILIAIFSNLPIIVLVLQVIIMFILYTKKPLAQGFQI